MLVLGDMGDVINSGAGGCGDVVVRQCWWTWGTSSMVRLGDMGGCHRHRAMLVLGDMGDVINSGAIGGSMVMVMVVMCVCVPGGLLVVDMVVEVVGDLVVAVHGGVW